MKRLLLLLPLLLLAAASLLSQQTDTPARNRAGKVEAAKPVDYVDATR